MDLSPDLVRELEESFAKGAIVDDEGRVYIEKEEVGRIGGLKVEIRSVEHPPPHIHVVYGGESISFSIEDCEPLEGDGLKQYYRNIRNWCKKNKQLLIDRWNKNRPTDCPVGPYRE